jgi:large subunit ribosomal protein L21
MTLQSDNYAGTIPVMFAVVEIAGKQYKVGLHDVLEVDHIESEVGKSLVFDKILMIADGDNTQIGTPYIDKNAVTAKVVEQLKGDKIHVMRYKSKVRYRKHIGFRPMLTKLEIVSIGQK